MDGKYLEQFGAIGDALNNLWNAAEAQHVAAQEQQRAAQTAVAGVTVATKALNDTARSLKGQLTDELRQAMEGAAANAARLLTERFAEANRQAERAALTYKSAASWTTFKVFLFTVVIGVLIVGAGMLVILHSVPSAEEMDKLRAEKAQLVSTIAALEKRGGRAVVSRCQTQDGAERLCVKVVDLTTGERVPMVIAGY
jgi:hypothetical protein